MSRRLHFTLIEMLIVIAILAVVMGVVSLNIGTAVRTERFRSGVALLVERMRLAQDIMLILRTSVRVKLEQKDDGLHCTLVTEGALTPALARAAAETAVIKSIRAFVYTDADGSSSSDSVTLEFLSGGSRMSRGKLVLASGTLGDENTLTEEIVLPGFPATLKVGEAAAEVPSADELNSLYPPEVLLEEQKRNEQKK